MYNWIIPEEYTMDTLLYFDRWVLKYLLSDQEDYQGDHPMLLGSALSRYPHVADFCRHKVPECVPYLDAALALVPPELDAEAARQAETDFLRHHETFVSMPGLR